MSEPESKPVASEPIGRRFWLTPDRLIAGLLAVECVLFLSNWLACSAWHKGYAVLTCVAVMGLTLELTILWFAVASALRVPLQFSVRSLFVLVVAVAVQCSWLGVEMKKAREQRQSVEAIVRDGGWAFYDFRFDEQFNLVANAKPPESSWLRHLLGDDFFCDVLDVQVMSNATAQHLESLDRLKWLYVLLKDEPNEAWPTELNDSVGGYVKPAHITNAALERIGHCRRLEHLEFRYATIGEVELKYFTGLSRLKSLDMQCTGVTDAALQGLKALPRLEYLNVSFNTITDAGLRHLEGLRTLRFLSISGTDVSDDGVRQFQQAMPNCEVDRNSCFFR